MAHQNHAYIDKSPIAGNGLFAGKAVPAGESILSISRPLIGTLNVVHLPDTCANCFTWTTGSLIGSRTYVPDGLTVKKCAGCQLVRYCSKKCQKESWKRFHKDECELTRSMIGKDIPTAVRATMQILIMRAKGLINDETWSSILRLESHVDDMRATGGDRWAEIQLMAQGAWSFSGTRLTFTRDFATEMFARILTNCLTLVTPTFDPIGICLDPLAACANHSCDPNAVVVMDGPEMSFRSLKSIKKDEEIFISYIDVTNPHARRQHELKQRWYFSCTCSKCQKGPNLREDLFNFAPNKLDRKFCETADMVMKTTSFADDPANWVGAGPDARRVAIIQGMAFDQYETSQARSDPKEAIARLEDGMRLCFQSKLWPIHRQPYASMRHDLFVNMISVGNYFIAFAQGAKTYFHIDPILFPQPHHPVRVVHNWTLAMLTLYLASEPDAPGVKDMVDQGIDLGVIMYGLLYEVISNVSQSHGQSSSFGMAVRRKMEEVSADMTGGNRAALPAALRGMQDRIKDQWKLFEQVGTWIQY
ncbi:SET domain-containing protein [Lepidopterella palustris CBS 459.81]|uniref:SET domain-containing protein n=1 Tax=Lepidopterella palustris CBS 459.81 TaxID=1314670 RepID=A0A8E2EJS5_9PEZI|nr:SET domain-containing protein [Lepidopterella palustris CBS 459.81]